LQLIPHRTIRGFIAAGLLGLFALAMTPKIAIHALVAHHQDVHLQTDLNDQLNTSSFHCATDNLVVELPFIYSPVSVAVGIPPRLPLHRAVVLLAPLAGDHPLFGLRGPPAAC